MGRKFKGKPITKETINLGVAGEIVRDEGWEPPPGALVTMQLTGRYSSIKHTFAKKGGGVIEALVLTIEADSFEVIKVEEVAEQLELDEDGDAPPPGDDDEPDEGSTR